MLSIKTVGPQAAALKYDILTAIGAFALAGSKHDQRLCLRVMTLITARYNWTRNELAVGQREIGELWSVNERTVKREMAKLRGMGWLIVKRQGARGRVTEYRLDIAHILETTRDSWAKVGPDFDLRMQGAPNEEKVIPLPTISAVAPPQITDGTEWELAQAVLYQEDSGIYASWLAALTRIERAGGRLVLRAPSRFHGAYVQAHLINRVKSACQVVDADVAEITILS